MPVSGTRLVDANVWLALAFSDHAHHHVAVSWFEGLGEEEAAFCLVKISGLSSRGTTVPVVLGIFDPSSI
jgi:predicted nucleic acid-binding protein